MNSKDVVVRIVQPAEQPKPRPSEPASVPVVRQGMNLLSLVLNGLMIAAIAALGTYLAVSFFHLGFSFNDIMIMVGLPLAVSMIATYAIV